MNGIIALVHSEKLKGIIHLCGHPSNFVSDSLFLLRIFPLHLDFPLSDDIATTVHVERPMVEKSRDGPTPENISSSPSINLCPKRACQEMILKQFILSCLRIERMGLGEYLRGCRDISEQER